MSSIYHVSDDPRSKAMCYDDGGGMARWYSAYCGSIITSKYSFWIGQLMLIGIRIKSNVPIFDSFELTRFFDYSVNSDCMALERYHEFTL